MPEKPFCYPFGIIGNLCNFTSEFPDDFKRICLEGEENVWLLVVSFRPSPTEEDTSEDVEALISSLQLDYPQTPMSVIQVYLVLITFLSGNLQV